MRAGSNPATSDGIVGLGPVVWTGTAARTLASAKMDTDGLDGISTTYPTTAYNNILVAFNAQAFKQLTGA